MFIGDLKDGLKLDLWDAIFEHISKNNNNESNMIDSTTPLLELVNIHLEGKVGKKQAIGKSREGLSNKIHLVSYGNGLTLKFELTGGNIYDKYLRLIF